MPKILMPIGDAVETLDTFYAYFRLAEDGFDVVLAGPEARLYHTVLHEIPPNPDVPWDSVRENHGDRSQDWTHSLLPRAAGKFAGGRRRR